MSAKINGAVSSESTVKPAKKMTTGVVGFLREREIGSVRSKRFGHCKQSVKDWLERLSASPALNQPCEFSGEPKATFLVDFSPDRTKIASAHGDHTVRVTEISTGKCTHILTGHPRTPWCLAFHPSHGDILASGCLGGQVRIWDLRGGGSEVFNSDCNSLIASLTFHPIDRVLVFSTKNMLYFWDWTQQEPFKCCNTGFVYDRVRWVKFDTFGHYLYTGISNNTTITRGPIHDIMRRDDSSHPNWQQRQANRQRYERLVSRFFEDQQQRIRDMVGVERPTSPVHEDRLRQAYDYARYVTSHSHDNNWVHLARGPPRRGATSGAEDSSRPSASYSMFSRRPGTNSPPPRPLRDNDNESEVSSESAPGNTESRRANPTVGSGRSAGARPDFFRSLTMETRLSRAFHSMLPARIRPRPRNGHSVALSSSIADRNLTPMDIPAPRNESGELENTDAGTAELNTGAEQDPAQATTARGSSSSSSSTSLTSCPQRKSLLFQETDSNLPSEAGADASHASHPGSSRVGRLFGHGAGACEGPARTRSNLQRGTLYSMLSGRTSRSSSAFTSPSNRDVNLVSSAQRGDAQSGFPGSASSGRDPSEAQPCNSSSVKFDTLSFLSSTSSANRDASAAGDNSWPTTDVSSTASTSSSKKSVETASEESVLSTSSGVEMTSSGASCAPGVADPIASSKRSYSVAFGSAQASTSTVPVSNSMAGGGSSSQAATTSSASCSSMQVTAQGDQPQPSSGYSSDREKARKLIMMFGGGIRRRGYTDLTTSNSEESSSDLDEYVSGSHSCTYLQSRLERVGRDQHDLKMTIVRDMIRLHRLANASEFWTCDFDCSATRYSRCPVCKCAPRNQVSRYMSRDVVRRGPIRLRTLPHTRFPVGSSSQQWGRQASERTSDNSSQTQGDMNEPEHTDRGTDVVGLAQLDLADAMDDSVDMDGDSATTQEEEALEGSSEQPEQQVGSDLERQLSENDDEISRIETSYRECMRRLNDKRRQILFSLRGRQSGSSASMSPSPRVPSAGCASSTRTSAESIQSGSESSQAVSDSSHSIAVPGASSQNFSAHQSSSSSANTGLDLQGSGSSDSSATLSIPVDSGSDRQGNSNSATLSIPVDSGSDRQGSSSSDSSATLFRSSDPGSDPQGSGTSSGSATRPMQNLDDLGPLHTLPTASGSDRDSIEVLTGSGQSEIITFCELARRLANREDVTVVGNHRLASTAPSASTSTVSSTSGTQQRSHLLRTCLTNSASSSTKSGSSSTHTYPPPGPASQPSTTTTTGSTAQRPSAAVPLIWVQRPTSDEQQRGASSENSGRSRGVGDAEWYSLEQRHLHPHYSRSILDETINRPSDAMQSAINRAIAGVFMNSNEQAVASNIVPGTHRIQRWDFRQCEIPDISQSKANIVVEHCKIHNDASIDVSRDSSLLATFVNNHGGFPDDNILAVFSLRTESFGQCLYTKSFGPNAISVSLSPSNQYVMVGLASKRMMWIQVTDQLVGQIFKLSKVKAGEYSMMHVTDLYHPVRVRTPFVRGMSPVSVNSARWLPDVGEGIVYGTNHGDLHFYRVGRNKTGEAEEEVSKLSKPAISTQCGSGSIRRSAFTQTAEEEQASRQ